MNRQGIGRIAAVLTGAAVLFGLQQGLDMKLYFALPLAVIAYAAVKIAFGLTWGAGDKAT